jgi:uncharacterized membrane protein
VETGATAPLRMMRIMKLGFIVFGLLLICLVIKIPVPSGPPANPAFELVVIIVALTNIAAGFLAPRFFRRVVKHTSQGQPGSTTLNQWMGASIISLACFNACMLFGFVLHFLRARVQVVEIAFAAGMISLLVWNPQPPPTTEEGKPFQTSTDRTRGHICYCFGVLFPVVYLSFVRRDRQQPFLRFHCMQCLLLFALLTPLWFWKSKHLSNTASIAYVVLMIGYLVATIQAGRGRMFKLPVLGRIAERLSSGVKSSFE